MKRNYLSNDKIYLRAPEPEDLDLMYNMENDPSSWDVSCFTVPYSRYVLRQYIEASQCDIFADKQLRLMMISRENNQVIGTIDLTDFVPMHSRAGVGIAVKKDFRQQGFAHQALELLISYSFEFLHLRQLYAYVSVRNEASRKLFISCGFTQVGVLKDWLRVKDGYEDAFFMQLINLV
ncbi:GNAT family protein [uncultured Bacteroides sp.]|uniref:GNAT family N-acetyltransferase n=1 Tax=uncultured Bacteroides sp. TaxID=162156 RepID=UPI002AAAB593|nr:GNAT family protein [uncultured Bacteroides sp.]